MWVSRTTGILGIVSSAGPEAILLSFLLQDEETYRCHRGIPPPCQVARVLVGSLLSLRSISSNPQLHCRPNLSTLKHNI